MRPARVIRDHPADGAGSAAPGIGGKEQPVTGERRLQIREHQARLDDGLKIGPVDLEDPAHLGERHDDPTARGDRAARLAGPRPARDDRGPRVRRHPHRGHDVGGGLGDDHDVGTPPHPKRPERGVVRVRLERRRIVDHPIVREHGAET